MSHLLYPTVTTESTEHIDQSIHNLLKNRTLILASNRGPVTFRQDDQGNVEYQRVSGGLIKALAGVIQHAEARWIACARTPEDIQFGNGLVSLGNSTENVLMQFLSPSPESYHSYYRVIANPLLWFLQHSMWNIFREPTIDRDVWDHWENGYVAVNRMFAEAISQQIASANQPALVMLQDYHLYLAPGMIRHTLRPKKPYTLAHFVHIPWPGAIDAQGLRAFAETEEVQSYREQLMEWPGDYQIILRIDRIEPSKNIVRGFKAFEQLLELHPEHRGNVKFLALLVPSRLGVSEYGDYLNEVMGLAGRVNAKYGGNGWEPIRIIVEENCPRAIAGLQIYDILLANSIADGMNLIAKEGPIVNRPNGILVLSERTGAFQQLEPGVLAVSPLDVYGTARALHQALTMSTQERRERAEQLSRLIEKHDIVDWLSEQLNAILRLHL